MIDINNIKHKRIFCFGCSFTEYIMPTWADILKLYFENTGTEVYNFGRSGAGNYYMFNNIVEKGLHYDFTKDDLILIQWSGIFREDRYKNRFWWTPGNILSQSVYSKSIVDNILFDEVGMMKRDFSYVHAIQKMLEADNIDYEMFSMNGLVPVDQYYTDISDNNHLRPEEIPEFSELTSLYHDTLMKVHPSVYKILWNNKPYLKKIQNNPCEFHPLPTEHLSYLEKVFQFKPSDELRTHIDDITKELLNDNT
jgi:hypothetical protein